MVAFGGSAEFKKNASTILRKNTWRVSVQLSRFIQYLSRGTLSAMWVMRKYYLLDTEGFDL